CTTIDWFGINIAWGILSTPVIDPDSNTLFAVNWVVGNDKKPALFVHRVRLHDAAEVRAPPAITAALKYPSVTPVNHATGRPVVLHRDQKVRAALLLAPLHGSQKTLFLATTGGENPGSPHGWVVAFDVKTFQQTATWVSTPNSFGGGMWQGSQG